MTNIRADVFELNPIIERRRQKLRLIIGSDAGNLAMTLTPAAARSLGGALLSYALEAGV